MNRVIRQTFTSNGTWTCPAGVTSVIVIGCGGGSGGQGGAGGAGSSNGGRGGNGAVLGCYSLAVIPNTGYAVVVGAGGAGGSGSAIAAMNNGSPGGDSSFNG